MASGLSPIPRLRPYRSSSTSGGGFSNSFPKPKRYRTTKSRSGGMSLLTALKMIHAAQKPHHSFLGNVLHKAGHSLETALDYTARPSYAYMEGIREGVTHHHVDLGKFYHGLGQGIHAHKRTGFGDIIRERAPHFAKEHKVLTALTGLGVDIGSDPTNLLMFGTAGKVPRAAKGLFELSSKLQKGEIAGADLTKAAQTFDKAGWKAHKALAEFEAAPPKAGEWLGQKDQQLGFYHEAAKVERAKMLGSKNLAVKVKVPFSRAGAKEYGVMQRGYVTLRTPIKAPSVKALAGAHIPIASPIAERIGRAVKPGWNEEEYNALEQYGKRLMEQQTTEHMKRYQSHLSQFFHGKNRLSQTQIENALEKAVTNKKLLTSGRDINLRELNKMVKNGVLTKKQALFLLKWHDFTEYLRHTDIGHGINYEADLVHPSGEAKFYVPMPRSSGGQAITPEFIRGSSKLTAAGFTHERVARGREDLQILRDLREAGDNNVVTDPMELLAMRAKRSAIAQANSSMLHTIAHVEGVPTQVLNPERIGRLAQKIDAAHARREGIVAQMEKWAAAHESKHTGRLLRRMARTEASHQARKGKLETNLRRTRAYIGKRTERSKKLPKRGLPAHGKLLTMKSGDLTTLKRALAAKAKKIGPMHYKKLSNALNEASKLRMRKRAIENIARKARKVQPTTGAKAHGKHWKALLHEVLNAPHSELDKEAALAPLKKGESWKSRFDNFYGSLKHAYEQDVKKNKDVWEQYRPQAETPLNAIRQKQLQAIDRLEQGHAQKIEKIGSEEAARRAAPDARLQAKLDRAQKRLDIIDKKIERLHAQAEDPYAFGHLKMANPEVEAKGLSPVTRLKDENGVSLAISQEMHAGIARMQKAVADDHFLEEFAGTWRKLVGKWKIGVTVVNPGYRLRNTMSDLWNMYISGVPMWGISRYGGEAAALMAKAAKGNSKAIREIDEMYRHGILSGLYTGDIARTMEHISGRGTAAEKLKRGHVVQAFAQGMTTGNRHAENWGRITHYLYRRRYERMSATEAAAQVKAAHFDYEDLTPAERKLKGSLVPFYTWTRKNIPYQLTQLLSRPGRYSAFQKMINESEGASGDNRGQLIPSWMKSQLAFHTPFGGKGSLMIPQFGPTDIEKLQHPDQLLNMIGPFIKTPAELAFNRSLLTGGPIYGKELKHPRNPIAEWAAGPLSLIPGSNVGQTERPVHGKMTAGEGANPLLTYFMGQTPWTNLALSQSSIKKKQRGGTGALASWLSGVSTYQPDQESQLAQLNAQEQLSEAQWIRGLRDMGIIPEPKRKKSKHQKQLDSILKKQHSRR